MSNKPIKVTDQNKPWNRKKEPSDHKAKSREMKKTILIVTEGQTEELYFKSFPIITSFKVKAVNLEGQSKLKLINLTEGIVEESHIEYDEIWCVFDMDFKNGAKELSEFDNAISQGQSKGYKIAYSNDAFEVWFYLHYSYNDQKNIRSYYYKELGKYWNMNYEDEGKKYAFCERIYEILEEDNNASQENAIRWASKLHTSQKDLAYHQQNPVTTVYQLVETLNKNLKP